LRDAPPSSLGLRIRKARQDLGLSLAAVAGTDFSRAFLNQIELGSAQPSTHTLQIIARRLQQPIDYFLEGPEVSAAAVELTLAEAEMRLHQGDHRRAEQLMTTILRNDLSLEVRTRAQLVLAGAYIRRGAAPEAMPILEEAIAAASEANLDSITAVVIGGTSLFGGRGTVFGSLLGALIVGVFRSGLSLAGVDDQYAIGEVDHFIEVGRVHHHCGACISSFPEAIEDGLRRCDVEAARRVLRHDERGSEVELTREHELLLIAP